MRFDWYQATVPAHPVALAEMFKAELAPTGVIETGKGRFNYHQSFIVRASDGDRRALILAGGPNGDPNVTTSGETTPAAVEALRRHFPAHRVTRFDAAEDFIQAGAWDTLEKLCKEVAIDCEVKGRSIIPDDITEGRTYYMGASSSDVQARLYEKTAQIRKSLPESMWYEVPDDWNRLEIQVRPKHPAVREFAATLAPEQIWGFSGWSSELAKRALHLEVQRLHAQAKRETDHDRAFRVMCQQYSKVLLKMHDDVGDWSCVGLTIGEMLKQLSRR